MKILTALQVIALFCAFLVISIPVTSAMQIKVYSAVDGERVFSLDVSERIYRNFEVSGCHQEGLKEKCYVDAKIYPKEQAYPVKRVYLFPCWDLTPSRCIDSYMDAGKQPITGHNSLTTESDASLVWDDVGEKTTANFLSFVKMEHEGRDIWVAFWDRIEKVDVGTFEAIHYEVKNVDISVKEDSEGSWVESFMKEFYMVPMEWVDAVSLGDVGDSGEATEKVYRLSADKDELSVPGLSADTESGNIITSAGKDYMFVLGGSGEKIVSPLTLYSLLPATCGDSRCDDMLGENSDNCCIDCPCPGDGEECTANGEYPNGLCHVCGDGVQDAVEDSENCCRDVAGEKCPGGLECKLEIDGESVPHGTCVPPECGDGTCGGSENVTNCCIDCGGNDECSSFYGAGYYCDERTVRCVENACGNGDCEPGESIENCCRDCGGNEGCSAFYGSDYYCNTTVSGNGVCMPVLCGNKNVEPGETPENCCIDAGCPQPYVCESNMCHLCGDNVLDEPVENEDNCCADSGCSAGGEYCTGDGSCENEGVMGLDIVLAKGTVDCTVDEKITLLLSLRNAPKYLDGIYSAYYAYGGSSRIISCQEEGSAYRCEIPLTGENYFPGCFESGKKAVTVSLPVQYYKDQNASAHGAVSEKTLTADVDVEIVARERQCNMDGWCDVDLGERGEECCWDCECDAGVCAGGSCVAESSIKLAVDDVSGIDCAAGTGEVEFSASVEPVPYSGYDDFQLLDWVLHYNGNNYTAWSLPGFSCEAETGNTGLFTGEIGCSIPVSVFPPCPYDSSPAEMTLEVAVNGGGLSNVYGFITGMRINGSFSAEYSPGLPNCGTNWECDEGETPDNCCRDCGCPAGNFCSLYSGCVGSDEIGLSVSAEPSSIDCSPGGDRAITIVAEIDPRPLDLLGFEGTDLERTSVDHYCTTDYSDSYVMRCEVPTSEFPYCWETGEKSLSFETSIVYMNGSDVEVKGFSKTVDFEVTGTRERDCVIDWDCDAESGELMDQCCADCGCSGGRVCAMDNSCREKGEVSMNIDPVPPVDCSGEYGYFVTLNAEIVNRPYYVDRIDWYIEQDGKTYGSDVFYCMETMIENEYECEISVYNLPLCHTHEEKEMTLIANMSYVDALGYYDYVSVENGVRIETENWLDSCTNPVTGGNPVCETILGENERNCCQDCGCSGFGSGYVCTAGGCKKKSEVKLTISPQSMTAECTLIPTRVAYDEEEGGGQIDRYSCHFTSPLVVDASVENLPVHTSDPTDLFFHIDGQKISDFIAAGERSVRGWEIKLLPRAVTSSGRSIPPNHKLGIGFSLLAYDAGGENIIPLESDNVISLTYKSKESDSIISVENKLRDMADALNKMDTWAGVLSFITGFCTACFGQFIFKSIAVHWGIIAGRIIGFIGMLGVITLVGSITDTVSLGILGGIAGYAAHRLSHGLICIKISTTCLSVTVLATVIMFSMAQNAEGDAQRIRADIENDIALGQAEVYDDISFYYD